MTPTTSPAPPGYVLVPIEPNEAMTGALNEIRTGWLSIRDGYNLMLAAAPAAPPVASHDQWLKEAERLLRNVRVAVAKQCIGPCAQALAAVDGADAEMLAHLRAAPVVAPAEPVAWLCQHVMTKSQGVIESWLTADKDEAPDIRTEPGTSFVVRTPLYAAAAPLPLLVAEQPNSNTHEADLASDSVGETVQTALPGEPA